MYITLSSNNFAGSSVELNTVIPDAFLCPPPPYFVAISETSVLSSVDRKLKYVVESFNEYVAEKEDSKISQLDDDMTKRILNKMLPLINVL